MFRLAMPGFKIEKIGYKEKHKQTCRNKKKCKYKTYIQFLKKHVGKIYSSTGNYVFKCLPKRMK